jgi:hypothetical protein
VPALIYSLCAVTSLFCAWLLLRGYREQRITLLFWCGLFFAIQACNDLFLVVDKLVVPDVDLSVYRYVVALMAIGVLLYGLVMRTEVD